MIDVKELRCGNWVKHDDFINPVQWTAKSFSYEDNFAKSQPIELSSDILLKSGFLKWNAPSKHLHLDICIRQGFIRMDLDFINGFFYLKSRYDEENLECQQIDLKYLHQLQNLYFSLTGEELSINL